MCMLFPACVSRFVAILGQRSRKQCSELIPFQIFTGKVPFAGLRDATVISEVAVHDRRPTWPGSTAVEKGLTEFLWFVMQDCWQTWPNDRPDMPSVVSRLEEAKYRREC